MQKYIIEWSYAKHEFAVRRAASWEHWAPWDNYWLAYGQARRWTEARRKRK